MMAVEIAGGSAFTAGTPKALFEGQYVRAAGTAQNHDISPDGQRFLMIKAAEQASGLAQINVVLNWFEELKQKVR